MTRSDLINLSIEPTDSVSVSAIDLCQSVAIHVHSFPGAVSITFTLAHLEKLEEAVTLLHAIRDEKENQEAVRIDERLMEVAKQWEEDLVF